MKRPTSIVAVAAPYWILLTSWISNIQCYTHSEPKSDSTNNNKTHWEWDRNHYIVPAVATTTTAIKTDSILHHPSSPLLIAAAETEALLVSDAPTSTLSIYQQQQQQQQQQPSSQTFHKKSLLMIQDAGMGAAEREICDITSRVSKAYAKRWTFDYLKFTGIAMDGGMANPSPWLKTFNRPFLLNHVLEQNLLVTSTNTLHAANSTTNSVLDNPSLSSDSETQELEYKVYYDVVLMMDSVQIIANMDYDPFRLLLSSSWDGGNNNNNNNNNGYNGNGGTSFNSNFLLAWGNVVPTNNNNNNNSGRPSMELRDFTSSPTKLSNVMVWNMNHPTIRKVASQWLQKSALHVSDAIIPDSSQLLLDILKQEYNYTGTSKIQDNNFPLASIPMEMIDGLAASFIKEDLDHFDKNHHVIVEGDLPVLIPTLSGIADSVCYRFYPQCELI